MITTAKTFATITAITAAALGISLIGGIAGGSLARAQINSTNGGLASNTNNLESETNVPMQQVIVTRKHPPAGKSPYAPKPTNRRIKGRKKISRTPEQPPRTTTPRRARTHPANIRHTQTHHPETRHTKKHRRTHLRKRTRTWKRSRTSSRRRYTSRMPSPGYEGFDGIGLGSYCSYRREPWRKCFNNRYGEEQCRTVGWRRIEHCY